MSGKGWLKPPQQINLRIFSGRHDAIPAMKWKQRDTHGNLHGIEDDRWPYLQL